MIARILIPAAASLAILTAGPASASSANRSPVVLVQASSAPWIPYCQQFRNRAQRERCTQEALSGFYGGYGPRYGAYFGYYEPRYGGYSDHY